MSLVLFLSACTSTIVFDYGDKDTGDHADADTDVDADTDTDTDADTDTGGSTATVTSRFDVGADEWVVAVHAEDISGDGREDVVYVGGVTTWSDRPGRAVTLYAAVARGGGRFEPVRAIPLGFGGGYGLPLHFADVDGDGIHDVVAELNGTVAIVKGGADGLGALEVPTFVAGEGIAVGDVDTDGDADIVSCVDRQLTLHRGEGDGSFPASGQTSTVTCARAQDSRQTALLTDLDRDGALDYARVSMDWSGVELAWGGYESGAFEFAASEVVPVPEPYDNGTSLYRIEASAAADDGHPVLVGMTWYEGTQGYASLLVHFRGRSPSFAIQDYMVEGAGDFTVEDIDHSGTEDLVYFRGGDDGGAEGDVIHALGYENDRRLNLWEGERSGEDDGSSHRVDVLDDPDGVGVGDLLYPAFADDWSSYVVRTPARD